MAAAAEAGSLAGSGREQMSMEIGFPALLGILLMPAVTFALAYRQS